MRTLIVIIALAVLSGCQGKQDGFSLQGTLAGAPEGGWIYLMDGKQQVYYDSVQLHEGQFEFQGKMVAPELRSLVYFKNPQRRKTGWKNILVIPVFMDNSKVTVEVPFNEMPSKAADFFPASLQVAGSEVNTDYYRYRKGIDPLNEAYDKASANYRKTFYRQKGTDEQVARCVYAVDSIRQLKYNYGVSFLLKHPDSPVALYVAGQIAVEDYGRQAVAEIVASLPAGLQNREVLKGILEDKPLYLNDTLPDMELLAVNRDTVRLSALVQKGHYTLVEFWASWCNPCRADIPHLKETYKRFHPKGFNIVSISIDTDAEKWLKTLDAEKMPWMQACTALREGHGNRSLELYGVRGIPAGFLVNPAGKIVLMNARGGWLNTALVALLE